MAGGDDAAGGASGDLEAMMEAFVGFALQNPHLCRLMFGPEVKESPYPVVREAAGAVYRRFRRGRRRVPGGRRVAGETP